MSDQKPWETMPPKVSMDPWEGLPPNATPPASEVPGSPPVTQTDPNLTGATLDSMAGGDSKNFISTQKANIADDAKYWENKEPRLADKLWKWAEVNKFPVERMQMEDHTVGSLVRSLVNGITFGGAAYLRSWEHGTSVAQEQQAMRTDAQQAGIPGMVADTAGQMASTAAGMRAVPALFGVAKGMGGIAKTAMGAISGGTIGATNAVNRGEDPAVGAATGAIGGAVGAKIGGELGAEAGRALNPTYSPNMQALKTQGEKLYALMDQSGMRLNSSTTNQGFNNILQAAVDARMDTRNNPNAVRALAYLKNSMTRGGQMTLQQVDKDRELLQDLGMQATGKDQDVIWAMKDKLDNMVYNLKAGDIVGAKDPSLVVSAVKDARSIWTAKSKLGLLEDAARNADMSNQPFDQAIKSEYRKIAKAPDFETRWTKPEQDAIMEVVNKGSITGMLVSMARLNRFAVGPAVAGAWIGNQLGAGTGALIGASAGLGMGLNTSVIQPSIARAAAGDLMHMVGTGVARPGVATGRTLGEALGMTGAPETAKNVLDLEPMRRPENVRK